MTPSGRRLGDDLAALGAVSAVSTLVALGASRGLWLSNLHNAALAVTSALTGALLLSRRPGQREARQFLAIALVSAVVYAGRQVGLDGDGRAAAWWGWLGVWPTALVIAQTTLLVLCFPEGRFLSHRWRIVGITAATAAIISATLSALWPVEYATDAIVTPFPFTLQGYDAAATVWDKLAHPLYALLQVAWLVGLAARWRASDSAVRQQLLWLVVLVAGIVTVLFAGLAIGGTPTPGLLAVGALPLAVGWMLDRLSLAHVVELERAAGRLDALTPRENEVLDLMARGLSNQAISERLHLSIKTVEPAISSIFRKLGLDDDPASNRRVLAVVQYWRR
ncbi:regulatory protein, luxR family [Nocardioides terrae]|uniref:Regulatory protein, luxR family n=1 Tax=Nocardioides terrae TaxID=574651 RepID=A0A1I1EKC0_9ACTN|nr:helix-turn-helix transcriptional regulator [Nocardioides terrae]SFB85353.1 regulatory protein, luxR family [Nocardioides terrae]